MLFGPVGPADGTATAVGVRPDDIDGLARGQFLLLGRVGEPEVGRGFAPSPRRRGAVDVVIEASLQRYGTEISRGEPTMEADDSACGWPKRPLAPMPDRIGWTGTDFFFRSVSDSGTTALARGRRDCGDPGPDRQ